MKKTDGKKVDRKITDRNISQGKRTKKQGRKFRGRKMTDERTGDHCPQFFCLSSLVRPFSRVSIATYCLRDEQVRNLLHGRHHLPCKEHNLKTNSRVSEVI